MENEIFIRKRNKLLLKQGSALIPETRYISTILCNVQSLGFYFSSDLLSVLNTYTVFELQEFYLEIVPILKKLLGANATYCPLYPNFPKQVMDMEESELYWNAMLHYITSGRFYPDTSKKERLPLWNEAPMRKLDLGTEDEFYSIFTNLMCSKTSISEIDKADLAWFFKNCSDYFYYLPNEIAFKENVAYIGKLLIENAPLLFSNYISQYFKTATDVLRLATALSNGDISLSKNTRYRSFKRKERRLLLELLENCKMMECDMANYKERWIRLGERLHPGEYKGYEKVKKAFDKLRNGQHIYSFGGSVAKAMKQNDYKKAVSLLKTKPGEFARKLDYMIRNARAREEQRFIISEFEKISSFVATPILLQMREHFKHRGSHQPLVRVFFPKGVLAKAQCIDNALEPFEKEICDAIVFICEQALLSVYSKRKPLGKVYINPKLNQYLVPFSQRSAGKAFKTIVRGSKLSLNSSTEVVRTFLWWKNGKGRTDLDLSAVIFDENWVYQEHISFTNLKSRTYKACHSGDIVDAPFGASEFIDVDIDSLKQYGCRYLAFMVFSYTGQKFCELPECFMGFMERDRLNSGEIYEPKTVQNKIDITSNSQIVLPILFDVQKREYIWADLAVKRNSIGQNTVEGNQNSIIASCRSMVEIKKPNLYDLILLNVAVRGTIWGTKDDADVIFDIEEGITPYDLDIIAAQYL